MVNDSWHIEPRTSRPTTRGNQSGQFYVVVNDRTKRVANDHWHEDEAKARRHLDLLIAFFGDTYEH